jgi:mannitol-1-phosphate 5-dehydrogenase
MTILCGKPVAVVFGAGNIGRGFLADLLNQSDFSIVFIDVDVTKVDLINYRGSYVIATVSEVGCNERIVEDISAIALSDTACVIDAIIEADVVMTAVGKSALPVVAKCLADGLNLRQRRRPNAVVGVVVIACENVLGNSEYLRQLVCAEFADSAIMKALDCVVFPNCVVDRIVPNLPPPIANDPLSVLVEDYFQLVIDGSNLFVPPPVIHGMQIVHNLEAVLDQKLCTLNMAHAILAYYGYMAGYHFIHEAIKDKYIFALLYGAFGEVEKVLIKRHESISLDGQRTYSKKILSRFKNSFLPDEVGRVAREPVRKLGFRDRLVFPALLACEQGLVPVHLATGIAAAYSYRNSFDGQAVLLAHVIDQKGINSAVEEMSGISSDSLLGQLVVSDFMFNNLRG